jgi:drug/metabolite transporter (DMT)-like permease
MPLSALLLLVVAAVCHSTWNLLSKRSTDKQAFLWLAIATTVVLYLPIFVVMFRPMPLVGLVLAGVSGVVEGAYYLLLGSAYAVGDLSVVYPLARGSAPLLVALAALFVLGERPTPAGAAGILLIVAGVYALHLTSFDRKGLLAPILALRQRASQLALLVGVTIATYSLIDKIGVGYVNPVLYIYLIFVVAGVVLAPYMLLARRGAIVLEWRANWRTILMASVLFAAAYLVVLVAFTRAQVAYVSAVREMSVVFGAAMGALILREPFGDKKVLGATLIFAGILCIAVGG